MIRLKLLQWWYNNYNKNDNNNNNNENNNLLTSFLATTDAPLSINTFATSKWPPIDASCNGVFPAYEWHIRVIMIMMSW